MVRSYFPSDAGVNGSCGGTFRTVPSEEKKKKIVFYSSERNYKLTDFSCFMSPETD